MHISGQKTFARELGEQFFEKKLVKRGGTIWPPSKNNQEITKSYFLCLASHDYSFQVVKVEKRFPGAKFDAVTSFSTI